MNNGLLNEQLQSKEITLVDFFRNREQSIGFNAFAIKNFGRYGLGSQNSKHTGTVHAFRTTSKALQHSLGTALLHRPPPGLPESQNFHEITGPANGNTTCAKSKTLLWKHLKHTFRKHLKFTL